MIFLIALIVLVSITYLSLSPKPALTASNDKLGHFIAYSVLTFLILRSFVIRNVNRLLMLLVFSILYGVLMEYGQRFVPGRSFSIYDMIANTSGVLIGLLIYWVLKATRSKYI